MLGYYVFGKAVLRQVLRVLAGQVVLPVPVVLLPAAQQTPSHRPLHLRPPHSQVRCQGW
jgi:hypothetical protein